jgi:hypothetical protein
MANKTATFSVNLTYTGAGGNTVTEPVATILAPYQGAAPGSIIDVPAGATGGVEYDVDFGAVGIEATGCLVKNNLAVPISMKINGASDPSHPIAPGGMQLVAGPTGASGATGAGPLLSMKCVLGGTQAAAGTIGTWVFGDPS